MQQIIKYPEKINVVIPAQNYETDVYTDSENCYLAQALRKIGYEDVFVHSFGHVTLNSIYAYESVREFSSMIVQQSFVRGKDIYVTLKRKI